MWIVCLREGLAGCLLVPSSLGVYGLKELILVNKKRILAMADGVILFFVVPYLVVVGVFFTAACVRGVFVLVKEGKQ